jgi:hypothetical protein
LGERRFFGVAGIVVGVEGEGDSMSEGVGETEGVREVGGSFERGETVRSLQSISGFCSSNQGIPRIMECIPIGATRKVRFWGTPAIVIFSVTCRLECVNMEPFARETRTGEQGSVLRRW